MTSRRPGLLARLVGYVRGSLGSWLRGRLEGPRFYLGSAPAHPLHVGHAGPPVLEPGQHEQEVG